MTGIRTEHSDSILSLIFDRTDKKNAITDAMYGALADALVAAESRADVRVVLFRAAGDSFTAGNDLADFARAGSRPIEPGHKQNVERFLEALARCSRPVVAAVQGNAVGVGTTLLLHCDYVLVAENAKLVTPFVNLALVPEAASSHLLPARIGHVRAFAMFALGEPLSARQAVEAGVANQCVPVDELQAAAWDVAQRLARQPLAAVMATKRLMRNADAVVAQMGVEGRLFQQQLRSAEAREAFAAFAERRKPDFQKLG